MNRIAVVILNWNGKGFLEKFLPGVIRHSSDTADMVVIDNGSTDDSVQFLRNKFPEVKIILNVKNYGFAGGYNEGLRQLHKLESMGEWAKGRRGEVTGKQEGRNAGLPTEAIAKVGTPEPMSTGAQDPCYSYYMLLNSDVEVTENWLAPFVAKMESDENIAACQPKMLNYNVRDEFEYAGAAGGFIDKYGYPFCRGRIFNVYEKDYGQYDDTREIFWASGACLMVRADLFHSVGGFDSDFFAHMEEIDLCWRLKNMGYRILYCPQSVIYHVGGGTLQKANPQKTYYNFRNNLFLLMKNHARQYWLIKLFLRWLLDGIAATKFLFTDGVPHFSAVVRAYFAFYASLGKTWRKRKELQKNITRYATTGVYDRSLVAEFFLRGKKKFSELDSSRFL